MAAVHLTTAGSGSSVRLRRETATSSPASSCSQFSPATSSSPTRQARAGAGRAGPALHSSTAVSQSSTGSNSSTTAGSTAAHITSQW